MLNVVRKDTDVSAYRFVNGKPLYWQREIFQAIRKYISMVLCPQVAISVSLSDHNSASRPNKSPGNRMNEVEYLANDLGTVCYTKTI